MIDFISRYIDLSDTKGLVLLVAFVGIIGAVTILILGHTFLSAKLCSSRLRALSREIKRIDGNVSECDKTEELIDRLKNYPSLRGIAILFRNSLLKYSKDGTQYFCNKKQGSDFFNEYSLGSELFSGSIFAPSMLTGIGVLGTFVGLLLALIVFKDGIEATKVKEILNQFLGPASLAFVTSIAGVTANLFVIVCIKFVQNKYSSAISRFATEIDAVYPPNLNSESDLRSIGGIIEDDSVQSCIHQLNRDLQKVIVDTSSATAVVIAQEVTKYIKDIDDRTAEVIKQTLDRLQAELNRSIEAQMQGIKLAGESYVEATRSATKVIGDKYEDIGRSLNRIHESILSDVEKWSSVAAVVADNGASLVSGVQALIGNVTEQSEVLSNSASTVSETVASLNEHMQQMQSIAGSFREQATGLNILGNQISSGINEIRDFNPKVEKAVGMVMEANTRTARDVADKYNESITAALDKFGKAVEVATNNLSNTIEKLSDAVHE